MLRAACPLPQLHPNVPVHPLLSSIPLLPGRYGATPGLTSHMCSGVCDDGYECQPGSTSPRSRICDLGRYGVSGMCFDCAAGRYGDVPGATTAACSGLCPPGRWGEAGAQSSACSGLCPAGYLCPAGFTSPSPGPGFQCPLGRYSLAGARECNQCPPGRYGSSAGLATPACTDECGVGFACPEGAANQTPYVLPCQQGGWGCGKNPGGLCPS